MASKKTEIPQHELQALAKAFDNDIIAFFESEEGKREYEEWLQQTEENEDIAQKQGRELSAPSPLINPID